jgi:hypothetical protein
MTQTTTAAGKSRVTALSSMETAAAIDVQGSCSSVLPAACCVDVYFLMQHENAHA